MTQPGQSGIREELESLIGRSERELLEPLQGDHERLVEIEERVAKLEDPERRPYEVEGDAVRHAALTYQVNAESARLGLAGLAGAEQWVEGAIAPDLSWFDNLTEQFPGLDPATVTPAWDAGPANTGALMLYRGFRGEQIVGDLLRGLDLPTPPGFQGFSFAETTNNPGWDLMLHTANGDIPAQVKVAADASAIRAHFAQHPDVSVVYATSDAAQAFTGVDGVKVITAGDPWPANGDVVIDIGQTSSEVGAQVTDALAHDPTWLAETLEKLPLAALLFVAGRAGYRLLNTDDDATAIGQQAADEAKDVMINAAAGEIAALLIGDAISAPVTIATALGRSSVRSIKRNIEFAARAAEQRKEMLDSLA